jgi:hypothetical protein
MRDDQGCLSSNCHTLCLYVGPENIRETVVGSIGEKRCRMRSKPYGLDFRGTEREL